MEDMLFYRGMSSFYVAYPYFYTGYPASLENFVYRTQYKDMYDMRKEREEQKCIAGY